MKRKSLSMLLTMAGLAVLLFGCGSDNAVQTPTEEIPVKTEQKGPISLTVWGAEEDQALLAEMVEGFRSKYGSEADFDITLEIQGESDCKERLLSDIEGSADVFAFADDQLRALVAAGALARVENADVIKAANTEGANDASSVNGTMYAYPMTADNGYFIFYNKAYLGETDIQTLDRMLEIAAENEKKLTMDWSSGWYLYSFFGCTDMQMGLNEDGVSNYCNWNATDTAIKGTDVAEGMLAIAANPGFLNCVDTDFIAGAKDGSVIAGISGVWNATTLEAVWGNDYGAAKLPTYTCAGKQVQMSSFAGYKMLGVNAYSEHVEWAQKLAEWITNEENQTLRFVQRGQGPSNINAAASEEIEKSAAIQAVIAQSAYASLQRVGGTYWDPIQAFGAVMAAGNPQGTALQDLLDSMVAGITASNGL